MITNEEYSKMNFTSFGFTEKPHEKESYRLPAGFKLSGCSTAEIRSMISNILHDQKEKQGKSITTLLEIDCCIPLSTYKQYIGGAKRRPSRQFIAKLCVGLKLPIEDANNLFRAHSGELNLTNDADAITHFAILYKDDIFAYEKELKEKAGISLNL